MGTSLAPVPSAGGDAVLTYTSGAGWLPAPANGSPAAFRSLDELLIFWEVTAQSYMYASGIPYSMNGVPVHTAICVNQIYKGASGGWLLFMAPHAAQSGWYYMMSYLNITPGAQTGPVAKGLKIAKYVAIKNQGNIGISDNWLFACSPDMNKLTAL